MGFRDYAFSLQMRDTLQKLVSNTLEKERPPTLYGVVDSIDRARGKCGVILTGSTAPVLVSMWSVQPYEVGQRVRVEGLRGDRYISDVLGLVWAKDQISVPVELGSAEHLDNLLETRVYVQTSNANTPGNGYPFESAGKLVVTDARTYGAGFVYQSYQEYGVGAGSNRLAWRSRYNGVWSGWNIEGEAPVDTGWLGCSLRGNFSHQPGFILQAKLRNGVVRMRGGLMDESIIAASQTYTVADLPDSRFWPVGMTEYQMGAGSAPQVSPEFIIGTGGEIQMRTNTAKSNYYLTSGISWDVS